MLRGATAKHSASVVEGGEGSRNAGRGGQRLKRPPVVNQKPRLMSACCKYFPPSTLVTFSITLQEGDCSH